MNHFDRIYQDENFIVKELVGEKIEQLLGVVMDNEADNYPMIINLKTTHKPWQRFFHDAGIAFWEQWETLVDESGDNDRFVDYGKQFELEGKIISLIECINSKITIDIQDSGQLIFECIEYDGESEIKFIPNR